MLKGTTETLAYFCRAFRFMCLASLYGAVVSAWFASRPRGAEEPNGAWAALVVLAGLVAVSFMAWMLVRRALRRRPDATAVQQKWRSGRWQRVFGYVATYAGMLSAYYWVGVLAHREDAEFGGPLRPAVVFTLVFAVAVILWRGRVRGAQSDAAKTV